MSGASGDTAPAMTRYGPVTVLWGERGGRYPDGNSLLVEGERENVIIDPAVGVALRADALPRIDRVINSHCHEDHVAGNHLFPDVPWHLHEADLPGITSLDQMMAIYGFDPEIDTLFRQVLVDKFHYTPRLDAVPYRGGDRFDLGGVTIDSIHAPGHTRGHCCLLVEWRDAAATRRLLYLGDIELTSFGPYYGDAWSSLKDFEQSLAKVREIEADWYATFHHIGVLEGRTAFLERLDLFASVIDKREARLIEFLAAPHSLEDIVEHRFVYRPGDAVGFADPVERRSMSQHVERLLEAGTLQQLADGRFVVA